MKETKLIIFVGICLLLLWSCSTASQPKNQAEFPADSPDDVPKAEQSSTIGTAIISVDETLKPIIEAQIAVFEALYPNTKVYPRYYPGEQAIREMLINDSISLAVSSRELTEEETSILLRHKINPNYADVLIDGIVLLVHKDNPVRTLSHDQMLDVLSGKIKSWQEIDPEAPEGEIVAVFEHAESSTIRYLQDSIMQGRPLLSNRYAKTPTSALFDYVKTQERALGIAGFGWVSDRDDPEMRELLLGTKILRLGRDPNRETICGYDKDHYGPYQAFLYDECYPLARTIKTILREGRHLVGTGFVSFMDGPRGQRAIHKSGLATVHTIPRRITFPPVEGAKDIKQTE
ncbi:MAG: PstS family phosphate ABC transporter substrate-binding protein [Bacteroidia bacterium]